MKYSQPFIHCYLLFSADENFRSHFIETVLKQLPNVKTVITVHKSVSSKDTLAKGRSKDTCLLIDLNTRAC